MSFIESIGDWFVLAGTFISNFFQKLTLGFQYIASAVSSISDWLSYIPSELVILASAIIGISVVYLILGR